MEERLEEFMGQAAFTDSVRTIALLALLIPLSGCIGNTGDMDPCELHVPSLRIGDAATYTGTGILALPTQGMQTTAAGPNNGNQRISLSDGDVRIEVVEGGTAMDFAGQPHPAARIEYHWLTANPVMFATESLRLSTGHVIQYQNPRFLEGDSSYQQWTLFGMPLHPGALWSTYLAGETLTTSWHRHVEAPGSLYVPGYLDDGTVAFDIRVASIEETAAGCVAQMIATADRPIWGSADPTTWTLTIDESSSLPKAIEINGVNGLIVERKAAAAGTGTAIGAFDAVFPTRRLPKHPLEHGAPTSSDSAWNYPLHDALQGIRADPSHQDWMQENPGARIVEFFRRLGSPNHYSEEEWWVTWTTPTANQTWSAYVARDPLPLQPKHRVTLAGFEPQPGQPKTLPTPSLGELERAATTFLGEAPEHIHCRLQTGSCNIGIHDQTLRSRGGDGGSLPRIGMVIDIHRGIIMQDDHWEPR